MSSVRVEEETVFLVEVYLHYISQGDFENFKMGKKMYMDDGETRDGNIMGGCS